MFKKTTVALYESENDFKVEVEAMVHLRAQFLKMPFEEFVNVKKLRNTFSEKEAVAKYLSGIGTYLGCGTDCFRYFMLYLEDAKTAEVAELDVSHDIHTDTWGRIENWQARRVLGFAMGFQCFSDELNVAEMGFERDPCCVVETVSTELGDVQIFGCKNKNGNFHGYCQILQNDGAMQHCFFNDGKILARRIEYANGMCEDVKDTDSLVVDPFAPRTVYELCGVEDVSEDDDSVVLRNGITVIKKVNADKETVEMLFNTIGSYSLRVEYRHYVEYPYDQGDWETEKAERTPTVNMALLTDGQLFGVLVKTNGKSIIAFDSVRRASSAWDNFVIPLDEETVLDSYTFTLRKKDEKGDAENEAQN